ncbi:MAG: hypothetical protein JXR25_15365 [Pontiellaceae bacterium]|nr:hypothetical protein [Pontiellaceae bacterium]MBN2786199.1 hypothetical protein [Pontiellaceae bacterium]
MVQLDLNPSTGKLRQFGWIAPIMLQVLGLVLRWRVDLPVAAIGAMGLFGLLVFIVSRVESNLVRPVYVGLMLVGFPIGWIVSHLLMFLFYFGIITPVALVFRLIGRDKLHRRWEDRNETYWTEHPPCDSVERYFRQF